MVFYFKKSPLAVLAVLAAAAAPAHAQWNDNFRVNQSANQAAMASGASAGSGYQCNAGYRPTEVATPYYSTGMYTPYYDPYGGFMSGVAADISAQGQFLIQEQQSKLTKEQVNQAKIDTRRRNFDEWLYERANRPTMEDDREKARMENIRRSRNKPPLTEIWSGKALNDLLDAIQKMHDQRISGPTVPLNEETLKKINVTTGATEGSLGLLRDDGKLQWPYTLTDTPYDEERKKLDTLAVQAYKEAEYGRVKPQTIRAMTKSTDNLVKLLKQNIRDVTPNDYVEAKRYLNEMDKTIRVLRDPDVSKFVTRKWAAKGNTVSELVQEMKNSGLKFAPAVRGDEAAYTALHSAMVEYYSLPSPNRPWDPMAK
jgi:hypothetical protein